MCASAFNIIIRVITIKITVIAYFTVIEFIM